MIGGAGEGPASAGANVDASEEAVVLGAGSDTSRRMRTGLAALERTGSPMAMAEASVTSARRAAARSSLSWSLSRLRRLHDPAGNDSPTAPSWSASRRCFR